MMIEGIQDFMRSAGETACYALCVIRIAEIETGKDIDPVKAMLVGIRDKHIRFDWNDYNNGGNFYMDHPARFLHSMTKEVWDVKKEARDYQPKLGEYVVQRWERETTGKTFGHFRLPDWDSLIASKTVQFGRIVSTRVFYQT